MSIYDERPWLARYDEGMPADIELEHANCLDMFRASARRHGDEPLIHYFRTPLTLAQVDRMTDAYAVALKELGVQPGDRVAAYLQNIPQFVLTMLAAWKAGAIMVSINPMWREREARNVLVDSGAVVLVTLESLWREAGAAATAGTNVRAVVTTSALDLLDGDVPQVLARVERERHEGTFDLLELVRERDGQKLEAPSFGLDDVALLTYTSGTTGPPKGAMNTHRNVVFNSQSYRDIGRLRTGEDIVLGIGPLFHVTGLLAHIGVGLVTPVPLILAHRFDPATTLELIEHHRATFTVCAITALRSLMDHPDFATRDLSSLTKIWSGGAPIPVATADEFERRLGTYVHNIYGLTETSGPSHAVPYGRRAPVDPESGALSVGLPIWNTTVRIVDENREVVPPRTVGEIVTIGPQVVSGYWRNPEETENAMPGGEFHTGDLGFMDDAGWFYVVDRLKDQINASGNKVWPREVEDVLYEHSAVREAAVVGVPDPYRGETVKAFVSLRSGQEVDPAELIAFCKQRMAAYKYPREVEFLDELPKNETGKIMRRELRTLAKEKADA